jgi:hypothetical protein
VSNAWRGERAIEGLSFFTLNGFISFRKAGFLSYLSVGWKSLSYSRDSDGHASCVWLVGLTTISG